MYIRQIALSLQVKSWLPVDHHLSLILCTRFCCSFCAVHASFYTISKLCAVWMWDAVMSHTVLLSSFLWLIQALLSDVSASPEHSASLCQSAAEPRLVLKFTEGLVEESFSTWQTALVWSPLFFTDGTALTDSKQKTTPRAIHLSLSLSPLPTGVHAQSTAAHMGLISPCGNACMCVCVCRLILCSIRLSLRQHPTSLLCKSPQSLPPSLGKCLFSFFFFNTSKEEETHGRWKSHRNFKGKF